MSQPTLKDLLLVPDHQIDYESLDNSILQQLATQREEPFLATSALGQLSQRDDAPVRDVADEILHAGVWDKFLTSYALTLLFDRDPAAGIEHMSRLINECPEVNILEAMAENVLNEPARIAERQAFVRTLVAKLQNIDAEKLDDPDVVSRLAKLT